MKAKKWWNPKSKSDSSDSNFLLGEEIVAF